MVTVTRFTVTAATSCQRVTRELWRSLISSEWNKNIIKAEFPWRKVTKFAENVWKHCQGGDEGSFNGFGVAARHEDADEAAEPDGRLEPLVPVPRLFPSPSQHQLHLFIDIFYFFLQF